MTTLSVGVKHQMGKNHKRMMYDICKLLKITYFEIIVSAVMWNDPELSRQEVDMIARKKKEHFLQTEIVSQDIENWCIDVLTSKLLIRDKSGRVINPRN